MNECVFVCGWMWCGVNGVIVCGDVCVVCM